MIIDWNKGMRFLRITQSPKQGILIPQTWYIF
jgi:hypothetical protein